MTSEFSVIIEAGHLIENVLANVALILLIIYNLKKKNSKCCFDE